MRSTHYSRISKAGLSFGCVGGVEGYALHRAGLQAKRSGEG